MKIRWVWLCGVVLLWGGLVGCKDAKKEAYELKPCSQGGCTKPNRCLNSREGRVCIHPCSKDQDCPASMRCSGQHGGRFGISVQGSFCRRSLVGVGGSCRALKDGCQKGLMCFDGQCTQPCKKDDQCPSNERCISFVTKRFGVQTGSGFRVCLKAEQKEDQACDSSKLLCSRGLACMGKRCTKYCKNDQHCGPQKRCHGAGYYQAYMVSIGKPDFYYCMQASLQAGASCQKGPFTCQYGLECISGLCRKLCKSDDDCPGETSCQGRGWRNKYLAGIGNPDFLFCR